VFHYKLRSALAYRSIKIRIAAVQVWGLRRVSVALGRIAFHPESQLG
jgi:hypothetical protein